MNSLFAHHVWLENGWEDNVRLHWNELGDLTQIECNVDSLPYETVAYWVVPGMVNVHSHAFQRAMAGMTEIAGSSQNNFWRWRDLMYRFALSINPEQLQAIAAQLYSECLRHGYTSVCEFHYLHRAPDGEFYTNMAEMAQRVLYAAQETGMGITMMPVLYSYSDFNQQALREEQRRFATNPEQLLRLVELLAPERNGQTEIGVAPHSLRAASIEHIAELALAIPADRPIHIHIAEQQKEVDSCLALCGKRPVEWLYETQAVHSRWCLVHATHLAQHEMIHIAHSNAVIGICPSTEANLGDGFFALPDYLKQQGRFGIGSDSHVSQSPIEELRWLEYGQRLRTQRRNIAANEQHAPIGDFLWQASLEGGGQASGRRVGKLALGMRADLVVLNEQHPNLSDIAKENVLNTWIFSGNDNLVRDVLVGGQWCVKNGQHLAQTAIENRFKKTMRQLTTL